MEEKYQIFDDKEAQKYQLVVASNANIRKVCKVLTQCFTMPQKHRVYYAKHGDIQPQENESGDSETYIFKNRYNKVTLWPALAGALFYDGPSLLEYDENGTAYIPDENQEAFDKLIRSEVMRGRDDFLNKFGVMAPEVGGLLKSLANGQLSGIMSQLMQKAELPEMNNIDPTSGTGNESSSKVSEHGNQ